MGTYMNNNIDMGNVYEHVRESIGTFRGTSRNLLVHHHFTYFLKHIKSSLQLYPMTHSFGWENKVVRPRTKEQCLEYGMVRHTYICIYTYTYM